MDFKLQYKNDILNASLTEDSGVYVKGKSQ